MSESSNVAATPEKSTISEIRADSVILPKIPLECVQKVSLIGNLIIAFFGLAAGVYYFFKRLSVESDRDKVSRIREHSKALLVLIDEYDKCVNSSLNNQILKVMEKIKRDEICRIFTSIQHFLEANQKLIGFSEVEIQDIMQFHSVIDNSNLSRGKFASGSQVGIKSEYNKALKNAREICWKKMF